MEIVKQDPVIAEQEAKLKALRIEETQKRKEAMADFKKTLAYVIIMERFARMEKYIFDEIEEIQIKEMKKVFLLPPNEQKDAVTTMSKRDAIMTGVVSIVKTVKNQILED